MNCLISVFTETSNNCAVELVEQGKLMQVYQSAVTNQVISVKRDRKKGVKWAAAVVVQTLIFKYYFKLLKLNENLKNKIVIRL